MLGKEAGPDSFRLDPATFNGKRVLISAYLSLQDVETGSQGDSPTLQSLIRTIREQGGDATYLSYSEFGITGMLINIMEKLKKKSISNRISGSHTRWMYTAIFHFLTYVFSKTDPLMKLKTKRLKLMKYDICIFFYPYLFSTLNTLFRDSNHSMMILFEVNIERKFFQFQFSESKLMLLKNSLVKLVSMMESKSINLSDAVMTIATRDAKELSVRFESKPIHTLPLREETTIKSEEMKRFITVRDVMRMIDSVLSPEILKVTFIGSNYSLNVRSVEELIRLARNMEKWKDKIKFIIVGNVHHSFNDMYGIPENIIFTGFLRDFNDVMSASDFFIMFDYMGTGVESKSRVYSEYPGLTLALTREIEEYRPILKERLIPFDSIDSIEKFLKEFSLDVKRRPPRIPSTS